MMRVLAWKDYRELRGVWLAIALLAVVMSVGIGSLARSGLAGAASDPAVRDIVVGLFFALVAATGIVFGAQLFAGEKDTGALVFLDGLSGDRKRVWQSKLLVGACLTLAQAGVLFGILTGLGMDHGNELTWFPLVGLLTLFWGMAGGSICETASLSRHLVRHCRVGRHTGPSRIYAPGS